MKTIGLALVSAAGVAGTMQMTDTPSGSLPRFWDSAGSGYQMVAPADFTSETFTQTAREGEPSSAREFRLFLTQVIPGGSALAEGGFFQLNEMPTGYANPLEERPGVRRKPVSRGWTPAGQIYITGLPGGEIDGQEWSGWLVREGAKTYTTVRGAYRTVATYRVVEAPPARIPKPGEWMWKL